MLKNKHSMIKTRKSRKLVIIILLSAFPDIRQTEIDIAEVTNFSPAN